MILTTYTQIVYLFANAFRVFALGLYLEVFFSRKNVWCSAWLKKASLIGYYLLNSSVYLMMQNPKITLFSNVILFFVLTIPYKSNLWKRAFAVCSVFILGMVCEGIVGRMSMLLLENREHILVMTYVISNFLFYLVVLLLKRILREQEENLFQGRYWIFLTMIPFISIIADTTLILGNCQQWVNCIVISCLFIINIVFFYLYGQMAEKYRIDMQNHILQEQIRAYQQQVFVIQKTEDTISRLRHDYKNHMIAMKDLAEKERMQELMQYLDSMETVLEVGKQFVSSGNAALDGLINYKLNNMRAFGTKIEVTVNVPKGFPMEAYDSIVIVGNLMDNAIRALQEQKNGFFLMKLQYDKGMLFLHMQNSYTGALKGNGDLFFTTKEDGASLHGIGLSNVKRTAEKYNGELEIKAEDGIFAVDIVMYL